MGSGWRVGIWGGSCGRSCVEESRFQFCVTTWVRSTSCRKWFLDQLIRLCTNLRRVCLALGAPGLSASTAVRLKEGWQKDYEAWSRRSLAGSRYVYFWVDGIHFNIRLEGDHRAFEALLRETCERFRMRPLALMA